MVDAVSCYVAAFTALPNVFGTEYMVMSLIGQRSRRNRYISKPEMEVQIPCLELMISLPSDHLPGLARKSNDMPCNLKITSRVASRAKY